MKFAFHPQALAELQDAAIYYATQQPGLELRFIESVEAAIQRIVQLPSSHAALVHDIRRCLTRVFPYAALYSVEPEFILILAIMHCHRKPGYWRHRAPA